MRILIGTGLNAGPAEYQNIGDIAMLQVAVTRLAGLWPDAEILVLTDSPVALARFCPAAKPLSRYGAETWIGDRILLGGFHRKLPASFSPYLSSLKHRLAQESPALLEGLLRTRFRLRDSCGRLPKLQSFLNALRACDLLVICGSGGFADSCRDWNLFTLGLIEASLVRGARVALVGQGIGPLTDKRSLSRMQRVLPAVDVLSSRGTRGATDITRQIGIPDEVVLTTGDEAVEPAYESRSTIPGNSIGVNLRIAPYSGVSEAQADAIGAALRDFARMQNTTLIPLPIAFHSYADDRASISRLVGHPGIPDGLTDLDSPESLYAQTAQCRVVVTGAYHAAVFALSQGVPTICLSASDYYSAKFDGLRVLFGDGCAVINLEAKDMSYAVNSSIKEYWASFERRRPALLQAACLQIAASRDAYRRIRDLFQPEAREAAPADAALSIP